MSGKEISSEGATSSSGEEWVTIAGMAHACAHSFTLAYLAAAREQWAEWTLAERGAALDGVAGQLQALYPEASKLHRPAGVAVLEQALALTRVLEGGDDPIGAALTLAQIRANSR